MSEHLRFREPRCHSAPPLWVTPVNIRTNLIFLETRIIDLLSAADSMGLSSFKFFWRAPQKDFSARLRFGCSRSSNVFGTNRKRVSDFLLVRHSNLGPILHHFRDIAGSFAHDPTPIPPQFWGCSRWTRSPVLGSARAFRPIPQASQPWNYFRSIPTYITVPWASRTDRQTDRQMTFCGITALCV